MNKAESFLSKCFKNKDGRIVIWQNPNIPLWIWLTAAIASNLFMVGRPHRFFDDIAFGSLFTWAYLELSSGVNYFRRTVGVIVLLMLIINRFR